MVFRQNGSSCAGSSWIFVRMRGRIRDARRSKASSYRVLFGASEDLNTERKSSGSGNLIDLCQKKTQNLPLIGPFTRMSAHMLL
jgi:hypothetical protein